MAITVIPEARLGDEAQTTPENLRLGLNLSEFRSGLRHLAGSASMACMAAVATAGLIGTAFVNGQFEAVIFAGFTAITAYWMTVYSLAAGSTLFNLYRNAFRRADEFERQNFVLRKRVMEEVRARHFRGQEGEADDGVGDTFTSSASRFRKLPKIRRIPLKGTVQ